MKLSSKSRSRPRWLSSRACRGPVSRVKGNVFGSSPAEDPGSAPAQRLWHASAPESTLCLPSRRMSTRSRPCEQASALPEKPVDVGAAGPLTERRRNFSAEGNTPAPGKQGQDASGITLCEGAPGLDQQLHHRLLSCELVSETVPEILQAGHRALHSQATLSSGLCSNEAVHAACGRCPPLPQPSFRRDGDVPQASQMARRWVKSLSERPFDDKKAEALQGVEPVKWDAVSTSLLRLPPLRTDCPARRYVRAPRQALRLACTSPRRRSRGTGRTLPSSTPPREHADGPLISSRNAKVDSSCEWLFDNEPLSSLFPVSHRSSP